LPPFLNLLEGNEERDFAFKRIYCDPEEINHIDTEVRSKEEVSRRNSSCG
jgi:hypothetical protein